MKKIIYIALMLLVSGVAKGQDLNTVFPQMPGDIIYGLNKELKEHLLYNPKDTSRFVANAIYNKISRKAINSNFIFLQTSKAGATSIKLLPLVNQSKIICVVQTVCSEICDSRIAFYTDKWNLIDGSELFPERDINWFIKADVDTSSEKYIHARDILNMAPMKYTLSANEETITVEYNPKSFLVDADYKVVEPFLTNEPKVLKWDKVSFK